MENMIEQCLLYSILLTLLAWPLGIYMGNNKKGRDYSRTNHIRPRHDACLWPRLRRNTRNAVALRRGKAAACSCFSAHCLRSTQKRPRLLADKPYKAKTRCVPLAPPAAEYTKCSRLTARQSRSLLLLFGALLAQYAKKAAIARGLFINKRIWSATSDGGRAFWAQPC